MKKYGNIVRVFDNSDKNISLDDLKKDFRKAQLHEDIFRWSFVILLTGFVIYFLTFLAGAKNFKYPTVHLFIVIALIALLVFLLNGFTTNKKKANSIKEKGMKINKGFLVMIEEFELKKIDRNARISKAIVTTLIYVFLIIVALVILFPFYWMVNSSLKTLEEYKWSTPSFWPHTLMFSNYSNAFKDANLGLLFINTLYVGLVSTILSLIITVISAFAFARLEFKGKNTLFAALLATMMIPGELFTITNYALVSKLDWLNTFSALIIPFLVSVFYIYLLRQNFMQIPNELYLAAKVDGTSDLKYLMKVMIPLSLPTLISITILKMMGAWNSYVWPNLVIKDESHTLITTGLRNSFKSATDETDYPKQMAAVALVSLPLFLVFIFLRKYIMKGVARSGIKG